MINLDKLLELEAKATPGGDWGIESWQLGQINFEDAELIQVMRNSIKELCTELKAAREVIKSVSYFRHIEYHSEDCNYGNTPDGDFDPGEPNSDKECTCDLLKIQAALEKYDEARQG